MIRERWLGGRTSATFTLQWHLTNRCPFHCRHCYDRSTRAELSLDEALAVLADLQAFGRQHRVRCGITLTGGDPLHYPHFWELYRAIAATPLSVSFLGNPVEPATITELCTIRRPRVYQVSLEGLAGHNDAVRGPGHFAQTLAFLKDARRLHLATHVMLTLTQENLEQVLPLAESLRGLTERFTFNRLAQVGEGAGLAVPSTAAYEAFLAEYLAAAKSNPILGLKDNLFNIHRARQGQPLLPGCTGAGCGAAFNFLALLPDGELHACRKFPSPLGSIRTSSLAAAYASPAARRYREGADGCRDCRLRRRCGGCLAVTHGQGLDPLVSRDPQCFAEGR